MMEQISIYLTSIILGIMLFFSFVVAPVTFTALDEENARKFIRKILNGWKLKVESPPIKTGNTNKIIDTGIEKTNSHLLTSL